MRAWGNRVLSGRPGLSENAPLAWLIAPSPANLGFALRTTCAALLALSLALWMELDSPQWAAMTTWIVAQNSRGQSISKAKWRLIGTCIGAICGIAFLAAFPQEPWLLFPLLALGAGACCAEATFLRNFRSYALVLVAFTCTIIVLSGASQPDNIFMIAISRATYITLGIVCESTLAGLFAPRLNTVAHDEIRTRLMEALSGACLSMTGLLLGQKDGLFRSRALMGSIPSLADQIEFSEIEMGPHEHIGDHARAVLASISTFLARGLSMHIHMDAAAPLPETFKQSLSDFAHILTTIPDRLNAPSDLIEAVRQIRADLYHSRTNCLQTATDTLILFEEARTQPNNSEHLMRDLLESRILETALAKLILELDEALQHFIATQAPSPKDHFRFAQHIEKDPVLALNNGLRAAAAICVGGLIWEVTAWPDGATLAMFVAVTSTRFSSFENPVQASSGFLRGAVWAALVSWVLVFLVLPEQASDETLLASLFFPMLVGGLALRAPNSIGTAAAYNNFMPFMIGPANHSRMNEILWFNTTPAVVLGIALGVWTFRLVLPFDPAAERWRLRRKLVRDLRRLAAKESSFTPAEWMARSCGRIAQIIHHAGEKPDALTEAYLAGAMGIMTVGLLILRIQHVLEHHALSPQHTQALQTVLHSIATLHGHTTQPAETAATALAFLRPATLWEPNLSIQMELTRAVGSLEVMKRELADNVTFLDITRRFHLPRAA
ncbi:fusaric acid resistance protein FusB [Acetobacter orleanensis]|nr:fusaric acid resistance protein FusB [Acetobacter orleanensis]PCD80748.1 FUSC family protein [Acetobacter orleanensis]